MIEDLKNIGPCWIDEQGDILEAEGVNPGNIFEFFLQIRGDALPGGIVVSTGEPGKIPGIDEVKEIYVRLQNNCGADKGHLKLSARNPLFLSKWLMIKLELC